MPQSIPIDKFLAFAQRYPVIDARSEGEYAQGHLPGSVNIPLLNNAERAEVGTLYKQQGRDAAVEKGFELTGHKFVDYIRQAKSLAVVGQVSVLCWRGGMRSGIMAWLLQTAGLQVTILSGGYKAFRRLCLDTLQQPWPLIVLAGRTGSGKTELLAHLKAHGEQVVDLEGIACHKGSAFGALGQPEQPTQEQFENLLAFKLLHMDKQKPIWVEDESRMIGRKNVTSTFYAQMQTATTVIVEVPFEDRLQRIMNEYGHFDPELLAESTLKVQKRMGGQHVKEALEYLAANNITAWAAKLLTYYDKAYDFQLSKSTRKHQVVPFSYKDFDVIGDEIINKIIQSSTSR